MLQLASTDRLRVLKRRAAYEGRELPSGGDQQRRVDERTPAAPLLGGREGESRGRRAPRRIRTGREERSVLFRAVTASPSRSVCGVAAYGTDRGGRTIGSEFRLSTPQVVRPSTAGLHTLDTIWATRRGSGWALRWFGGLEPALRP